MRPTKPGLCRPHINRRRLPATTMARAGRRLGEETAISLVDCDEPVLYPSASMNESADWCGVVSPGSQWTTAQMFREFFPEHLGCGHRG